MTARTGAYFDSPWPAEDGGPARLQVPRPSADGRLISRGLALQEGEKLACVTRNTLLSTMTVLGAPGEVFLLTHSALRANIGLTTTSCVERIDPLTLATQKRSPRLPGGPMWPGGMAVHRNGDLYVVYGRYLHRLDRDCALRASLMLPVAQPYNSFVILDNGLLVMKNLSDRLRARLSVVDPETMQPVCAELECPEASIARLSAIGNTVYVVGVRHIYRFHWDAAGMRLQRDVNWCHDYIGHTRQSYGWDVVLDGQDAWFMDNGRHRYRTRMIGAGVVPTPNRLHRVALTEHRDHAVIEVCGIEGGSVTNPPLIDRERGIVLGYDAANRVLRAWKITPADATSSMSTRSAPAQQLVPLWRKDKFACASHMILYPDTGEVVINDYRRFGEEVVLLDIQTGAELGRTRPGGIFQGVVFPSVGWGRDLYWSSMGKLARVFVQ